MRGLSVIMAINNNQKTLLDKKSKDKLKLSIKKQENLDKQYKKYFENKNFQIGITARRTITYIEKNIINLPNTYHVLRDNTIKCCYKLLECIYRANVFQELKDKKEACVQIQMLNFYLVSILNEELITYKKYESYAKHLYELDLMIRSWFKYEKVQ